MKIPLELHALVVNMLASENYNLSPYAMTCSGLLYFCRAHIFAQIAFEFSSRDYQRRHVQFVQILANSPDIASMIRHIRLKISRALLLEEEEDLLKALRLNAGLIAQFSLTSFYLQWGEMLETPELGPFMRTCLASRGLHTLEIGNFIQGFKMADIRGCTQLSKLVLRLHRTVTFDDEDQNPSLICFPPNLRDLFIHHTKRRDEMVAHRLTSTPVPHCPLFSLHSFHTSTSSIELIRIILAQVKGLEEFILRWELSNEELPFTQLGESLHSQLRSLHSQLRSLRSLTFVFPYDTVRCGALEDLSDLLASMARSTIGNCVQDITVVICINRSFHAEALSDACGQLDSLLSSSRVWPSLQNISFETLLIAGRLDGGRAALNLQSLRDLLPLLIASGLLRFRFDHMNNRGVGTLPANIHPFLRDMFETRYSSK